MGKMLPPLSNFSFTPVLPRNELNALINREDKLYRFQDYVPHSILDEKVGKTGGMIQPERRSVICEQIHTFVAMYDLPGNVESLAISYFDRYFATMPSVARKQEKLMLITAITSLRLAMKITSSPFSFTSFRRLREHFHLPKLEIAAVSITEKHMLQKLQWKTHPPLPQEYMELVFDMLPYELLHRNNGRDLLKECVLDLVLAASRSHSIMRFLSYQVIFMAMAVVLEYNGINPTSILDILAGYFNMNYPSTMFSSDFSAAKTLVKRRKSSSGKHHMEMSSWHFLRTALWQVLIEDVSRAL